jgi:hypothetical protein
MQLPDGRGGQIELAPGEERLVFGEYEYFKRMPRQGVSGLVVKLEPGVKAPRDDQERRADTRLVRITNHRKIPMDIATGVDRSHVEIAPGATVEVVARESIVKQLSGITVRDVEVADPATEPEKVARIKARKKRAEQAALVEELQKTGALPVAEKGSPEEVRASGAAGKMADMRKALQLPETLAEWKTRSRNISWHDLRGIAKALGLKTKSRADSVKRVGETAYPEEKA